MPPRRSNAQTAPIALPRTVDLTSEDAHAFYCTARVSDKTVTIYMPYNGGRDSASVTMSLDAARNLAEYMFGQVFAVDDSLVGDNRQTKFGIFRRFLALLRNPNMPNLTELRAEFRGLMRRNETLERKAEAERLNAETDALALQVAELRAQAATPLRLPDVMVVGDLTGVDA